MSLLGILYKLTSGINIVAGIVSQTTKGLKAADFLVRQGAAHARKYIDKLSSLIRSVDTSVFSALYKFNNYTKAAYIGFIVYFLAVLVGFLLATAFLIQVVCFSNTSCLTAAKGLCTTVWLLASIGAVVALALSLLVPGIFLACKPLNQALASER